MFPVTPFAVFSGPHVVFASLAVSGLALILIGAGTSLYTGRSMAYSAVRQYCSLRRCRSYLRRGRSRRRHGVRLN